MDRKQYLTEKIKHIFKKRPDLTPDRIYTLFSKMQKAKFCPESIEEVAQILEFIQFDLELENELAQTTSESTHPIIAFLQNNDGAIKFYSCDVIAQGIQKHPQTVTRWLKELLTTNQIQEKAGNPPTYKLKLGISHFSAQPTSKKAELMDPTPQPSAEPTQSTQSTSPMVVCPHCKTVQTYSPRKKTARKHKYCIHCKKHFEIKYNEQAKYARTLEEKIDTQTLITSLKLNKTEKRIFDLLYNGGTPIHLSQRGIAEGIEKSIATVSRRVRKLIKLGILEEIPTAIKMYQIPAELIKSQQKLALEAEEPDDKINILSTHHYQSQIPILAGYQAVSYNILAQIPEVQNIRLQPMGKKDHPSWIKYHFTVNDLAFQITTKNLFFNVLGVGESKDACLQNCEQKTTEIIHFLEHNLPIQCGTPIYNELGDGIHYVNHRVSPDQLTEMAKLWEDKSHKGTFETTSHEFAERMCHMDTLVQLLTEKQITLETKIANWTPQIPEKLTEDLKTMIDEKLAAHTKSIAQTMETMANNMVSSFTEAMDKVIQKVSSKTNPPAAATGTKPAEIYI